MAKRRVAIIAILICLCLWLVPCNAMAASTVDAAEPISAEKECSLTLLYSCDGAIFSDMPVKLYQIAEISSDFQYSLSSSFADTGLVLNGIQSVGEWNVVKSTVEAKVIADNIAADFSAVTDDEGLVCFETLKAGLYLVIAEQTDVNYKFDSALISLPNLVEDGLWQYHVTAASKGEILPPAPDEDIEFNVLKLWKGDEGQNSRPDSIEVEIFRNGESYKTVTLTKENNWSYSWSTKDDGAQWVVAERNIPSEYTVTVENRSTTFLLTNTYTPEEPPTTTPETGDTSHIVLYTVLMYVSGIMLIVLAIAGKRRRT